MSPAHAVRPMLTKPTPKNGTANRTIGKVKLKATTAAKPRTKPLERAIDEAIRDSGQSSSLEDDISSRIGARIRIAREQRGESLRAFAVRSGVSASMLSDVERGTKSPTIAILSAIAEGLGVPLSSLVSDEQALDAGPLIVRAAEMPQVTDPESLVERLHLGPVIGESHVEFVRFILPPGKSTGGFIGHAPGTIERVYVARGNVEILLSGKTFSLSPGDAIMYRASVPHPLAATGTEPAEVYLVVERP